MNSEPSQQPHTQVRLSSPLSPPADDPPTLQTLVPTSTTQGTATTATEQSNQNISPLFNQNSTTNQETPHPPAPVTSRKRTHSPMKKQSMAKSSQVSQKQRAKTRGPLASSYQSDQASPSQRRSPRQSPRQSQRQSPRLSPNKPAKKAHKSPKSGSSGKLSKSKSIKKDKKGKKSSSKHHTKSGKKSKRKHSFDSEAQEVGQGLPDSQILQGLIGKPKQTKRGKKVVEVGESSLAFDHDDDGKVSSSVGQYCMDLPQHKDSWISAGRNEQTHTKITQQFKAEIAEQSSKRADLSRVLDGTKSQLLACPLPQQFKSKLKAAAEHTRRPMSIQAIMQAEATTLSQLEKTNLSQTSGKRQRRGVSPTDESTLLQGVDKNQSPCKRQRLGESESKIKTTPALPKTDSTTEEDGVTPVKDLAQPADGLKSKAGLEEKREPETSEEASLAAVLSKQKLDKEMKKIIAHIAKKGEQAINDSKSREGLVRLLKNVQSEITAVEGDPTAKLLVNDYAQKYINIQVRGQQTTQRVYLFEMDQKVENMVKKTICVFTFNEGGKKVPRTRKAKKGANSTKLDKQGGSEEEADSSDDDTGSENADESKAKEESKAIQESLHVPPAGRTRGRGRGRGGASTGARKPRITKAHEITVKVQQPSTQATGGLNALDFCNGTPAAAPGDSTQMQQMLMNTIRGFQQNGNCGINGIPVVPKPSKVRKPKAGQEAKTPKARKPRVTAASKVKDQSTLIQELAQQVIQQTTQSTQSQLVKPRASRARKAAKGSKKTTTEGGVDERQFEDQIQMHLGEMPSIALKKAENGGVVNPLSEGDPFGNTVELLRRKMGRQDPSGKQANNQGPESTTRRTPVKLPPNVKNFIADHQSANYTGENLAKLKENEMVCKLVYGHLNRSVEVTKKDFKFLEPGVYLNDILILFYLRFLQHYVIPKPLEEQVYIFDPQFFTKLQEVPKFAQNPMMPSAGSAEERYQVAHGYKCVKRWTKKIDLFQREYILVPICQDQHWTLAVICRSRLVAKAMEAHIAKCKLAEKNQDQSKITAVVNQASAQETSDLMQQLRQQAKAPPTNIIRQMTIDDSAEDQAMAEVQGLASSSQGRFTVEGEQQDSELGERVPLQGGGGGGDHFSEGDHEMRDLGHEDDPGLNSSELGFQQQRQYGQQHSEEASGDPDLEDQMEDDCDAIYDEDQDEQFIMQQQSRALRQEQAQARQRVQNTGMRPVFNNEDSEEDDFDESSCFDEQAYDDYNNQGSHLMGQAAPPLDGFPGFANHYKQAQMPRRPQMPASADPDKPVILFMDSLNADNADDMMGSLREYLELEYLEKKCDPADKKYFFDKAYGWHSFDQSQIPNYRPTLPKQKNFTDCGLFVLQYAETFLAEPSFVLNDLHQRQGTLFHDRIVDSKRDEIMRIIIAIAEQSATIQQMGTFYWKDLQSMKGKKTHFKKQQVASGEEEHKSMGKEVPQQQANAKEKVLENNSGQSSSSSQSQSSSTGNSGESQESSGAEALAAAKIKTTATGGAKQTHKSAGAAAKIHDAKMR